MKDEDDDNVSIHDHMSIVKAVMAKRSYGRGNIMKSVDENPDGIDTDSNNSAHMDDDLASQDAYMNENMGVPDEDPKARRRKMLSGIMSR